MMTPTEFHATTIRPGLNLLAAAVDGPHLVSAWASIMLGAVALQESGQRDRYQVLSDGRPGAARGFWQFEAGGGVRGVMRHARTQELAQRLCAWVQVRWDEAAIWRALEGHDGLAVGFARLLLLSDPYPMPRTAADGWACYLRTWRPGKPHPAAWAKHWERATAALEGDD
jgi:hypothetical protein